MFEKIKQSHNIPPQHKEKICGCSVRAIGIPEPQETMKRGVKSTVPELAERECKFANQRTITVNKEICDKEHLYTVNNIEALEEAMFRLQTKLGIKLYLYLAKHQDKHKFELFSSDFCRLCGCSMKGYRSAFDELVKEGYLVLKLGTQTVYSFYDKSQIPENAITIEINKDIEESFCEVIETPAKPTTKNVFVF